MADDHNEEVLEIYSKVKLEILEQFRMILVKRIEPRRFYPLLRSKAVFDREDEEDIESERTTQQKAHRFFDILSKRGQEGFDVFCEGLLTCVAGQLDLLKKLLDAFEKRISEELSELNEERGLPGLHNTQTLPCPGQQGGPELPSGYLSGFDMATHSEPPPAYSQY